MGLANDMKKLSEEILATYKKRAEEYQQRLKENEELVFEVQKTLDGFRKNHLEMAENLRANAATLRGKLNQGEIARLNAFGDLMTGIQESISTIQKEVGDIQLSTADLLGAFSATHREMAKKQNEKFAEARTDRKKQDQNRLKDFDNLMKSMQDDIMQSKTDVQKILSDTDALLKKYEEEHSQMSTTMHKNLDANLEERVTFIKALLKTFHERLTEIGNENRNLAETLKKELLQSRKELSANDRKRMEEFDKAMGEIRGRVGDIQNSIATLLNNLSKERMQATIEWKELSDAIVQIKNSMKVPRFESVIQPEPDVAVVEEETKVEEMPERRPTSTEKKAFDFPKEMSLEEKIITFVNAHPEGVKVSEMEEPLGEQRMRIGYVSKKLLEKGKLTKFENAYFPRSKNEKKEE